MIRTEDLSGIRLEIDTHHCQLDDHALAQIERDVLALAPQVERFPTSDLRVVIGYNSRTTDYSVKTSLILDGATLVASDRDLVMHAALLRCLTSLEENIRAFKDQLGNVPERHRLGKGTEQRVRAGAAADALEAAVAADDYPAFRLALLGHEESLRKRVGRWVERYPDVDARIGRGLEVADLVEEVFLLAFATYPHRPADRGLAEWLEGLIDQSVRAVRDGGDGELENIALVRAAVAAEQAANR